MITSKGRTAASLLIPLVAEAMAGPSGYAIDSMTRPSKLSRYPLVGCRVCHCAGKTLYKLEGEMICKDCKKELGL